MYKGKYRTLDRVKLWDYRYKNLLIYGVSDFVAALAKAPFEVRKQLIQLYSKDIPTKHLAKLI